MDFLESYCKLFRKIICSLASGKNINSSTIVSIIFPSILYVMVNLFVLGLKIVQALQNKEWWK